MLSPTRSTVILLVVGTITVSGTWCRAGTDAPNKRFLAGAAAVDITPTKLPVVSNGSFEERTATRIHDRLMARALVLDNGQLRMAICVVDNLMLPRDLADGIKEMVYRETGIPADRVLISATHTHSGASVMSCLGSRADPEYTPWLPAQVARAIRLAVQNLSPARIGWSVVEDAEHNHCRRWVFRSDRVPADPFGQLTVRANMHPGHQSAQHIGPAGPADPDLSLLSVQTLQNQPLAVLANYAMHYYGSEAISADFCGRFGDALARKIGATGLTPPFVGMMSQGTSGDSMWMDYSQPAAPRSLDAYTNAVATFAQRGYESIRYHDWVELDMAETKLKLKRRVPDETRLAWAREVVAGVGDRLPRTRPEIYAREQIYLFETPEVELKLQAVRIGELGITAIPNEVFGITGLKLKARSPLHPTFNIELANGGEGYIPPPEQHVLGGYTTWPARTAGLEVQAEPRIVAALLDLLEKVSGRSRRHDAEISGKYSQAVLASRPVAYWRLGEFEGTRAADQTGRHHGFYENGVAFFLPGSPGEGLAGGERGNRAAHFAGGRMRVNLADLGDTYSVEFWFWNGLPSDARPVCAYLFSRGADGADGAPGDHLGIGGTNDGPSTGRVFFFNGNRLNTMHAGKTAIELRRWYHAVLTRDGSQVDVYLNGRLELSGSAERGYPDGVHQLFFGGRSDNFSNLEGKLDEAAVYDRALPADEVAQHFQAAQ